MYLLYIYRVLGGSPEVVRLVRLLDSFSAFIAVDRRLSHYIVLRLTRIVQYSFGRAFTLTQIRSQVMRKRV